MQGGHRLAEQFFRSSGSSSTTSRGSGPRGLQQGRPSTEWRQGSGLPSGSTVESGLALFSGKRVLLVEVNDMVSAYRAGNASYTHSLHSVCFP